MNPVCLLDSMARVQSVYYKSVFVFVGDTKLITLSGWSRCLLLIGTGVMLLIFCNLSGCEQLVRCFTHIAGNRPDLVMTDEPDRVDVFVGHLELLITAVSVECVGSSNLYQNTMSEVLSF